MCAFSRFFVLKATPQLLSLSFVFIDPDKNLGAIGISQSRERSRKFARSNVNRFSIDEVSFFEAEDSTTSALEIDSRLIVIRPVFCQPDGRPWNPDHHMLREVLEFHVAERAHARLTGAPAAAFRRLPAD
jgi:hypothetical protein